MSVVWVVAALLWIGMGSAAFINGENVFAALCFIIVILAQNRSESLAK